MVQKSKLIVVHEKIGLAQMDCFYTRAVDVRAILVQLLHERNAAPTLQV